MSDVISEILCPCCASTATLAAHIHNPDDDFLKRLVRQCPACGFLFSDPAIEADLTDASARHFYDDWRLLDFSGIPNLYAEILAVVRRKSPRSLKDRAPRVLEVGCGAGQVLNHFRAHGWTVQGVEPWREVAAAGAKYLKLAIEPARLEDAGIDAASQDLVLSLDVLNFVADPRKFLEGCRRALKPGGVLYLTVPNADSAEREAAGWDWNFFVPTSHVGAYTAAALLHLAEASGFARSEIEPFGGVAGDLFVRLTAIRPQETALTWADLGGASDDASAPLLDRASVDLSELTPEQHSWRRDGMLILPNFLPDALIERYCAVREKLNRPEGWRSTTPYLEIPEIQDLCLYPPLAQMLEHLIGSPMGLHLNLTGWVSSERDWHQDDYLNPVSVSGHYLAVWMALDRIGPESGPFQFVRGSHRWPLVRQDSVLKLLDHDGSDDAWPSWSEALLAPFFESEILRRNAPVEEFLGERGDVLIWHARLLHRGSLATQPGARRKALISHYSAIDRRPDMGPATRRESGGYFFDLTELKARALRARSDDPAG